MREEYGQEFENLKNQFETFGTELYERIVGDISQQIKDDFTAQLQDATSQIRDQSNEIVMGGLAQNDRKVVEVENQLDDLRVAQEQTLEELSKYQDNLERMMEQNEGSIMTRVNKVISDLEAFKNQTKKDKIDPS